MESKRRLQGTAAEARQEAASSGQARRGRKRSPEEDPWVSSLREVLARDAAAALARNLGAPPPGEADLDPFATLARVLRDEAAVRSALLRLGGPALVALTLLLAVANRAVDLGLLREQVDWRLGAKGWGAVAQDAIDAAGLLLSPAGGARRDPRPCAVLPAVLADAFAPHLVGLSDVPLDARDVVVERRAETAWSDVPLALLLGSFLRSPPRVTQGGCVFVTALTGLARVFWPAAEDARGRVERLVRAARDLGLLAVHDGHVRVQQSAVRAWAALPPDERRLRRLALERGRRDEGAHAVFDRLLRAGGDGWVRSDELQSRAALALGAFGPQDYYWRQVSPRDAALQAASSVAAVGALDLVERGRLAGGSEVLRLAPAFRPGAPAPPGSAGRVYVQPNFEIIVPPDADFRLAFDLARVAELRRVEDAATLVATAASVAGARETGWTRTEIMGALERAAADALPQNVAATVAGWAGAVRPARFFEGIVFCCSDPEAAERMRRSPDAAASFDRELASGVWLLPHDRREAVARAARAAGVDFMPRVERVERDGPWASELVASPTDEQLAGLRAISVPAAPPDDLARVVAGTRALPPPVVVRRVDPPHPSPARDAVPPVPARKSPSSFVERMASLFRGSPDPFPDPDDGEPDVDLERLEWHPAAPREALVDLLAAGAREGIDLAVGYRDARGEAVRRAVAVERLRPRRGRLFVEAFAYLDDESVSLPVESIEEIAAVEPEDRALLACLGRGRPAPVRAPPRVGRNDPCPCGSGRKYKRCCGA